MKKARRFFYLDDYASDQPRDLLSALSATGDWPGPCAEKSSPPWLKKHRCAGQPAAAEPG
jgi:hypothetical protein